MVKTYETNIFINDLIVTKGLSINQTLSLTLLF